MKYLGRLNPQDPLFAYLRDDVYPQILPNDQVRNFRVFQFPASNEVFLYEETHSQQKVIGKFFQRPGKDPQNAWDRAWNEWQNLHYLRNIGLNHKHFHIPQAFGIARQMNSLVVEEYCPGQSLSSVMSQSLAEHHEDLLYARLTDLAWFLAKLHNHTAGAETVHFHTQFAYFDKIMARLQRRHRITETQLREAYGFREQWQQSPCMWSDQAVLIHGDATPSNFLFAQPRTIIAIDFERMKRADRAYDLGMIAGEIKHHFLRNTHHGEQAESYIGHFLWEYSTHFPDRQAAFAAITQRIPFYMGMTLLRIARNSWLDWRYSQILVHAALSVLRR
ncbi:aminoglycoside phosphotransferase family protein [Acidithiobacillus sulfurivorans]|uniref:Phosphotransferase n=1 Tax=Acidithiobacillus sulfurivorans TaxID=1958756 RepID=A0ABS5ZUV4_9PROT|nr:phosphotransferase [Acidithiobacillus sulfurivorans]